MSKDQTFDDIYMDKIDKNNNIIKIFKTKNFDIEIKEHYYERECATVECSNEQNYNIRMIQSENIRSVLKNPNFEFPLCPWCDDKFVLIWRKYY